MNLLIDSLPLCVDVDGEGVPVRTDFRTWLRVVIAMDDDGLTTHEKILILLANAYPKVPLNTEGAVLAAQWFMNGGIEYKESSSRRVISFDKDAQLIYAAFRQTHGIDLTSEDLHWWQFLALMQGLDSESSFRQLVNLRLRVKTGKATKEEKEAYGELGDGFDVPDSVSIEEREAQAKFIALIEEGERARGGA